MSVKNNTDQDRQSFEYHMLFVSFSSDNGPFK